MALGLTANPGVASVVTSNPFTTSSSTYAWNSTYSSLIALGPKVPTGTLSFTTDQGPIQFDGRIWQLLNPAFGKDNFNVGPLNRWSAAIARGAPNIARIFVVGDSTCTGEGGGTGTGNMTNARINSWPVVMAAAKGWQDASLIGDQNITVAATTLPVYDPRVTFGTGWASDAGISTIGGRFLTASAGAVGSLTFTPGKNVTKIRIWYPQTASANTAMVVKANGNTLGTINQTGSNALASVTYTIAKTAPTIAISIGATGTGFVQGIECWDDTNPAPSLLVGGICGAVMSDIAAVSAAWSELNAISTYATDAVILNCTVNDINAGVGPNGTYANLALINNAVVAAGGDVINVVGNPSNSANYSALAPLHHHMLKSNALSYGGAFSDPIGLFGYWDLANARGLMYDANHPSAAGYAALADFHGKIF